MSNTVPASFKPSGPPVVPFPSAGMLPGIPAQPSRPAGPRVLTYRLYGGGSLSVPCPAWCVLDHADDLDGRLHPVDLYHHGEEISIGFTTAEGTQERILSARITQYPFSSEGDDSDRPHMEFAPVKGSGETLGVQSAGEVHVEIRRLQAHLLKLQELTEQLAEARAEDHATVHRGAAHTTWLSLRPDDIQTMPVPYLLKAFDAGVVEVEPEEVGIDGELSSLNENDIVIVLRRNLTQPMREQAVRNLLWNKLHAHSPALSAKGAS